MRLNPQQVFFSNEHLTNWQSFTRSFSSLHNHNLLPGIDFILDATDEVFPNPVYVANGLSTPTVYVSDV